MDVVINVGPLAFSAERLAAILAIGLFILLAGLADDRLGEKKGKAWLAALGGMLAARLGFVIVNLDTYRIEPLASLYVWQGGFDARLGIAAAAAILLATTAGKARLWNLAALALAASAWIAVDRLVLKQEPRPLPPVAITDLAGKPVRLGAGDGPYVVNLWGTWCPPCRREMPMLVETAAASPEVPIHLVNQGESAATVAAFAKANGIRRDLLMIDPASRLVAELDVRAFPTTLFVSADGQIVRTHSGEISRAALLSAIRDLQRRE